LSQRARDDIEPRAERAITSRLTPEQHLLDGAEQRGAIDYRFDKTLGSDGSSLKLDASMTISAQVYSLNDIHERARDAATDRLRAKAGHDVTVLASTLRVSDPRPLDGTNGTAFAVDATATTRTNIDIAELDALRADLSGLDEIEALARIEQIAGVGAVQIERSPGWLGDGMPRRTSRIQIEVVDAATLPAQATSARP
ncbi:MAG: hypothetical protein ACRD1H_19340, partial [Vicinamibacterales bacterium]